MRRGRRLEVLAGVLAACVVSCRGPRESTDASPAATSEPARSAEPAPGVSPPAAEPAPAEPAPPSEPAPRGVRVRTWHVGEWGPQARLAPGSPPNSARIAPALDLDPARGDFGDAPRCWVARVDGSLVAPSAGRYVLRLAGGDSTRAYLDEILFASGAHSEVELDLGAGPHAILVEHAACGSPAALRLEWRPPGGDALGTVPSSAWSAPLDLSASAGGLRRTETVPRAGPGAERAAVEPPFDVSIAASAAQAPSDAELEALAWLAPSTLLGATGGGSVWKLPGGPKAKAETWIAGLDRPRGLATIGARAFVLQRRELSELADADGDGRVDSVRALWDPRSDPRCLGLEPVALAARGDALFVALAGEPGRGALVGVDLAGGPPRFLDLAGGVPRSIADLGPVLAVVVEPEPASAGRIELFDDAGEPAGRIVLPPPELVGPVATLGRPEPIGAEPFSGQALVAGAAAWMRIAPQRFEQRIGGAVFLAREEGGAAAPAGEPPCSAAAPEAIFVEAASPTTGAAARPLVRRVSARSPAPFEWVAARAVAGGLELEFSSPLALGAGWDPSGFALSRLDPGHGERIPLEVSDAKVDAGRRRVALAVPGLGALLSEASLPEGLARGAGVWLDLELGAAIVGDSGARPASRRAFVTLLELPRGAPEWIAGATPPEPSDLDRIAAAAGWTVLVGAAEWRLAAPTSGWTYSEGELSGDGSGAPLASLEAFEDFELELEWRVPRGGAGSVGYRGGGAFALVDEEAHADGRDPRRLSGAALDLQAPGALASGPPGAWNRSRIVAKGRVVEHWIGGSKVLELALAPAHAEIVLHARGAGVAFRSVRVRRLDL